MVVMSKYGMRFLNTVIKIRFDCSDHSSILLAYGTFHFLQMWWWCISKMETHWQHWHQHFPVTASTASAPSHPVQSTGASRLVMLCAMITGTRQCQGHNYWHQATITSTRTQSRP